MIEMKICKGCRFRIEHTAKGFYPNAKDIRYVDSYGRQWNGNNCPNCHAKKAKERAQRKAAEKNEQNHTN